MYKSPIEIMQKEMRVQMENGIMKAVQDVGINVDKDELLKALAYDREQYQKGFADGRKAGHEWISVWDRLPEDQRDVLTVNGHGNIRMMGFWSKRGEQLMWLHNGRFKHYNDITHWMPLPEPPKEDA